MSEYGEKEKEEKCDTNQFDKEKFEEFLDDITQDEQQKKKLRVLPEVSKSIMINEWSKQKRTKVSVKEDEPQWFVRRLASFSSQTCKVDEKAKTMQDLLTNLRTKNINWIQEFARLGFQRVYSVFETYNSKKGVKTHQEKAIIKYCVLSTVILLDLTKDGLEQLIKTPNAVREFAQVLYSEDDEVREKVLYLLTSVAIKGEEHYSLVYDAIEHLKLLENLVERLKEDTRNENKLYTLTFLNVMVDRAPVKKKILDDLASLEIDGVVAIVEKDLATSREHKLNDLTSEMIVKSVLNQVQILKSWIEKKSKKPLEEGSSQDEKFEEEGEVETEGEEMKIEYEKKVEVNRVFETLLSKLERDGPALDKLNLVLHGIVKLVDSSGGMKAEVWDELVQVSRGDAKPEAKLIRKLKDRVDKYHGGYKDMRVESEQLRMVHHRSQMKWNKEKKDLVDENHKMLDSVLDSVGRRFRIPQKKLQIHREGKLGKGGFGSVYKAELTNEHGETTEVAAKVIPYGLNTGGVEVFKEFSRSLQFQHENVIKTIGFDDSRRNEIAIVMERLDGNMHDYVRENILTLEEKLGVMEKMTKGVHYLHEMKPKPFLNRDIKGENFLYVENLEGELCDVKVCDFGLAKVATGTETQVSTAGRGTILWMAPEAGKGLYSVKSDVYSLGITFWEILFEEIPYGDLDKNHVFSDVQRTGLRPDLRLHVKEEGEEEEEVEDGYLPKVIIELLQSCWEPDRKKRPTARDLVLWFEDMGVEVMAEYGDEHFPPLEIQEANKVSSGSSRNKDSNAKVKTKKDEDKVVVEENTTLPKVNPPEKKSANSYEELREENESLRRFLDEKGMLKEFLSMAHFFF